LNYKKINNLIKLFLLFILKGLLRYIINWYFRVYCLVSSYVYNWIRCFKRFIYKT